MNALMGAQRPTVEPREAIATLIGYDRLTIDWLQGLAKRRD